MEEQLISFETAKLAKEKGFINGIHYDGMGGYYTNVRQSLLQKWLREQDTPIIITPETDYISWDVYIDQPDLGRHTISHDPEVNSEFNYITSYERALELGLQYGLKLIK